MTNSTIAGNTAYGDGGGVYNSGTLTLLNSTITGNTGGFEGDGGVANGGPLTVLNSTISGNTALGFCRYDYGYSYCYGGRGGGVANYSSLTVLNSTISDNSAIFSGGGVYNGLSDGTLTLARTLVTGNTAPTGPEITHNGTSGATLRADNHNLLGVNGTAGVEGFNPGPTDIVPPVGVQLADILDPTLANNGGPTQTHALVQGSPAIDAGGPACPDATGAPLSTDQRGEPRPVDGDGDGTPACDIGAVELQLAVPSGLTVVLDIKPGSPHNPINPKSHGLLPVAVLTTRHFDATTVNPRSVTLGPQGAREAHNKGHREDVNGDGAADLVLHFRTQETGLQCGETTATLRGETVSGQQIHRADAIKTVACTP